MNRFYNIKIGTNLLSGSHGGAASALVEAQTAAVKTLAPDPFEYGAADSEPEIGGRRFRELLERSNHPLHPKETRQHRVPMLPRFFVRYPACSKQPLQYVLLPESSSMSTAKTSVLASDASGKTKSPDAYWAMTMESPRRFSSGSSSRRTAP